MPTSRISLFVLACLSVSSAFADNWPNWRGPDGNGVAHNANPPTSFSASKNVRWKVAVPGRGSGSPVIWDQQVFVTTAIPTGKGSNELPELEFKLLCYDRGSGKLLWDSTATIATPHQATHSTNGFASASPCTDGKHVYAHFGSRGLYCYTMQGQLVWKRDDFGRMQTRNDFGEGSSPTIAGDKIIVPWDHEGPSALYALDKLTGKTVWKVDRDEPTNWSSPLVVDLGGVKQVVMNGQNFARAYDLATGQELWRCDGQTARPAASAVADDKHIYVGSGFRGAYMAAFRPEARGDLRKNSGIVWEINRDTPDVASPLLVDGRIYFFKEKRGILSCVDAATGKSLFESQRVPELGAIYASPIAAGGHIYLCDREGNVAVIEQADTFKLVASNNLGETLDASPAPVDNELFIRGEQHLFCIAEDK